MFHACSFLALNKKTIRSLSRCFGFCSATFPKLISTKHFTTFLNWFIRAEEILFACFSARVHVLFSYMLWASECRAIGIIFLYSQQYWNNVAVWTTEERKKTKSRFSENARWIALVYVLNIGAAPSMMFSRMSFSPYHLHQTPSFFLLFSSYKSCKRNSFSSVHEIHFEPLKIHLHWGIYSFEACCHKA